ncbi:MAG: hypothetical protein A3F13_08765 [Gammaproteobacteria bacterium RIFCSPHIGHO2_12_FULL_40_19]|nr:MAG: hypothetical protein A3F13_08765 [Gammaproteobacteria bacterium RIFCSPHIGHO2_12_FULL_40_19]
MNSLKLNDRKILVTGASSGIGAQTAITISQLGAQVILSGRNGTRLNATLEQMSGYGHQIITADLTADSELNKLVEQVVGLDGIVHSAGIVKPLPVKFINQQHIEKVFNINYYSPVLLMSKLFKAKKINKGASIIFMSSISSHFPHKGGALYSASKAAINAYSKTVALEYASKKIRSNVISAAMVKTPIFYQTEKEVSKEIMDKLGEYYPLGFGEPEDIANAISFLLSDASKWITGVEIVIDGGLTAGMQNEIFNSHTGI